MLLSIISKSLHLTVFLVVANRVLILLIRLVVLPNLLGEFCFCRLWLCLIVLWCCTIVCTSVEDAKEGITIQWALAGLILYTRSGTIKATIPTV
jgi:hypothetical protein